MLTAFEEDKLEPEVITFIERKLYDYPVLKKAIKACEEQMKDIRTRTRQWSDEPPPSNSQDSSVERKALKIYMIEKKIQKWSYWVRGIEDVIDTCTDEEKKLIKLKYFENYLNHNGVARELNMSRMMYYRKRKEILRKFAIYFALE